jgi:alpha-mannosidase
MSHNEREERLYVLRVKHLRERLKLRLTPESVVFNAEYRLTEEPVPFAQRLEGEYVPIVEGDQWGTDWQCAWFKLTGTVPETWAGRHVVAQIEIGGEGLVFRPDGTALQGITAGSLYTENSFHRVWVPLVDEATGGEQVELWVDAACNALFGIVPGQVTPGHYTDEHLGSPESHGSMNARAEQIRMVVFDRDLWALTMDMDVLISLVDSLEPNSVRRAHILRALTHCADVLGRIENDITGARDALKAVLASPANASSIPVRAVGHAHIDTAWLWPLRETIRKCGRTFSTQLNLIERYPGYVFGASAAQHYKYTKDHYPELYERIKQAIADQKWEVLGGMWIEADCNIPSGESLVRQLIHGKNFFRDEFGLDVDNLWIPDTFGYSAALPQIMLQAGIDAFLTQKISWNQINTFPHHTFLWQGIDGSKVLTHFPPENTYNSWLTPKSLITAEERFVEKAFVDEIMSLFGIGDGGGGPREDMIESGIRMRDLEGSPKVQFGMAREFFAATKKHNDELATWVGELYLELHRGTLTTHAFVKRCNRTLERCLRELEILWALYSFSEYPLTELDALWKSTLLHQFHDIIPGSSVNRVYEEAYETYDNLMSACGTLQKRFAESALQQSEATLTLFNSLAIPYRGAIRLPDAWKGTDCATSQSEPGGTYALIDIPPFSHIEICEADPQSIHDAASSPGDDLVLENDLIRYEFRTDGAIARVYDKTVDKEVLAADGRGNLLSLYHDRPVYYDAWDVDKFYMDELVQTADVTLIDKIASGPVRSGVRIEATVGKSSLSQNAWLLSGSKRIDFETVVDWKERHRMLRVSFAVNVATDTATFDIQYGHTRRPTHRNTSWDTARFEVAAHHYADLSDCDYGAALLNDCKYGYRVQDNVLDLNLLRSPTWPDPGTDQRTHHFTYSFLPHTGDHVDSDVQAHAQQLNHPPVRFEGYAWTDVNQPIMIESESVRLEALKKAEKEDVLVMRLVERAGRQSTACVSFTAGAGELTETNILEWEDGTSIQVTESVELNFSPFQIRTFKIRL